MICSSANASVRSEILFGIRSFFREEGFIEVETPVRVRHPAVELHIDAEPSGSWFLRTSPELQMKILLCNGYERIFQIGPCFRSGEKGRLHNPEYTMAEWYRSGSDYMGVLDDTERLLLNLSNLINGSSQVEYMGEVIDLTPPWPRIRVADIFMEVAGWNPLYIHDQDRFDIDLIEKIEPALPVNRPTVMIDYPQWAAALSKCRTDPDPVAERWELYIGGMELANAYSELTDPEEQRLRFADCMAERKEQGRDGYGIDEEFISALESGMGECGGIALGIDRLAMLFTSSDNIKEVMSFSF